ncbi:MAG: hypothetical protein KGN01_06990, partial [Patescibacteria group bacterium]|nr:hypothetical protein [Patescibacteria group bacterium]
EQLVVPTSSICTLSASTFGGNAVCAPTSAATFTATPAGAAINVPTVNTTGGAYIDAFAPVADGVGMFVSNGAPGADAPVGAGLSLIGGTGLNLTSGTTTTAGTLACLSGSETASQCASSPASGVVGVFVSSGQNALVQTGGIATINLAASATTTYNHYACASTSGTIVDSATPCSGVQQIGIIAQTNAVSVTSVPVFLMTQGAGAGGCSNCLVQNPTTTAANTITAQNISAVPLTINGFGNTGGHAIDINNNGFDALYVTAFGDLDAGKDIQSLGDVDVDANQTGAHLVFGSSSDQITFANSATASGGIRGQIVLTSQASNAVTFPLAYNFAPVCTLTPTSNPGALTWWVTTTNAAVTANLSASGTITFNYICVGYPN